LHLLGKRQPRRPRQRRKLKIERGKSQDSSAAFRSVRLDELLRSERVASPASSSIFLKKTRKSQNEVTTTGTHSGAIEKILRFRQAAGEPERAREAATGGAGRCPLEGRTAQAHSCSGPAPARIVRSLLAQLPCQVCSAAGLRRWPGRHVRGRAGASGAHPLPHMTLDHRSPPRARPPLRRAFSLPALLAAVRKPAPPLALSSPPIGAPLPRRAPHPPPTLSSPTPTAAHARVAGVGRRHLRPTATISTFRLPPCLP
jgi:hypothetical protein